CTSQIGHHRHDSTNGQQAFRTTRNRIQIGPVGTGYKGAMLREKPFSAVGTADSSLGRQSEVIEQATPESRSDGTRK
ncbi:MAG: hypothetical protein KDB03_28655, partial [Planctomycetales bacterium]|nr:hypothetical protein [Planctomycetales bacterium]